MTTLTTPVAANLLRDLLRESAVGERTFTAPADVLVDEGQITVHVDVPGIPRDKLEVELENNLLTIRGERPYPYPEDARGRIERGFGRFERDLRVPGDVDPDAVEADLADGVLTLRIPTAEPRPRQIEIAPGDRS